MDIDLEHELSKFHDYVYDAWLNDNNIDDTDDVLLDMTQGIINKIKDMNGRCGNWYIQNRKHESVYFMGKIYELNETSIRYADNIGISTITIYHANGEIDTIGFYRFTNANIDDFVWALENYPEKALIMFGKTHLEKIAELLKGILKGILNG